MEKNLTLDTNHNRHYDNRYKSDSSRNHRDVKHRDSFLQCGNDVWTDIIPQTLVVIAKTIHSCQTYSSTNHRNDVHSNGTCSEKIRTILAPIHALFAHKCNCDQKAQRIANQQCQTRVLLFREKVHRQILHTNRNRGIGEEMSMSPVITNVLCHQACRIVAVSDRTEAVHSQNGTEKYHSSMTDLDRLLCFLYRTSVLLETLLPGVRGRGLNLNGVHPKD